MTFIKNSNDPTKPTNNTLNRANVPQNTQGNTKLVVNRLNIMKE